MSRLLELIAPKQRTGGALGLDAGIDVEVVRAREQARTDRTGVPFAELIFDAASLDAKERQRLWQVIRGRIRRTDEAGWLRGNRIALLLPATSGEGAWKLAGDIIALFDAGEEVPKCEVYIYPSRRFDYERAEATGD